MPAIKKSDVLEDSVKKAFDDLNASVRVSVDLLVLLTKSAKDINSNLSTPNITQLANATSNYSDQLKNQLQIEQEVLKAEKLRIQVSEQARKATDSKRKADEREAAQTAKNASLYAQKSKRLNELRNAAKDVGIEFGTSSKQFKEAAKEVNKLDKELKDLDAALGQHQRKVGEYEAVVDKMNGGLAAFGLGVSAAGAALWLFNGAISGSQALGDAWGRTMGAMTGATDAFFSMLGRGDFSNFIENMQKAVTVGRDYADALDDLFEGGLGLDVAEANARKLILTQEGLRDDVRKTKEERMAAAIEINRIEEGITAKRLVEAGKEYKAHADYINGIVGLDDKKLVSFIENYRAEEEFRNKTKEKVDEILELEKKVSKSYVNAQGIVTTSFDAELDKQVKSMKAALTDDEKVYAAFLAKYEGTTDDMVTNVINSYVKLTEVESQQMEETKKNNRKLAAFEKEINVERVKTKTQEATLSKDLIAIKERELAAARAIEATDEASLITKQLRIKSIEEEIKRLQELSQIKQVDKIDSAGLDANLDKQFEELSDLYDKDFEDYVNNEAAKIEATRQAEAEKAQIRADYAGVVADGIGEIEDVMWENRATARDDAMQKEVEAMQARLDNEKLDDEQRQEIQKQIDKREKEIKIKKAKAEKEDKLMQIAMDTAMGIAKIKVQAAILMANPLTLAYGLAALAQIPMLLISSAASAAAVSMRKIPEYATGVESHQGGLAVVGDGGRSELVEMPDGSRYITPNTDTLVDLPKGTRVTPGEEVANRLTDIARREMVDMARPATHQSISNDLIKQLISETIENRKAIKANKMQPLPDLTRMVQEEIFKAKLKN